MKTFLQCVSLLAMVLTGCQGPEGPLGAAGTDGTDGSNGNNGTDGRHCWDLDGDGVPDPNEDTNRDGAWTALDCLPEPEPAIAEETCALCHGPSRLADISVMHGIIPPPFETPGPTRVDPSIDLVTIASGTGLVQVFFSLTDDAGEPYVGLAAADVRFSLAKLIPGTAGNASAWQNYINRRETKAVGAPGTAPDGNATMQGTTQTAHASRYVDYGDGSYSYVFTNSARTAAMNINDVVASGVTPSGSGLDVSYVEAYTHRVAAQFANTLPTTYNPSYTFRPLDGATTGITTRTIAATSTCQECHKELAFHGGGRKSVEYCVTCHNPGSTDANSNHSVDFKVMIHKIHMGRDLPSVLTGTDYIIWGNQNSENNFSEIGFPQPLSNCTKCHDPSDPATPDAASYQTTPTIQACGSCHDDLNFATGAGHSGGIATNSQCAGCHPATGVPAAVVDAHTRIETVLGVRFEYNVGSVSYNANTRQVDVTFSVTDPTNFDQAYDILGDPEFTALAGGVSRLAVIVGWDTRDYHNAGSGANVGQPISLNALGVSTDNADGTFTVATLLPAGAAGTGVAAIEGHPAGQDPATGLYSVRVPVKSALQYFAITDATPLPRRQAIDVTAKCDNCHGQLSVHGANRTDEGQVCVICHNPNATDIGRRPADHTVTATFDGKKEESIDFKRMIHGIHGAAKREVSYTVWGFGGTENVFGPEEVTFPGILNNCTACHLGTAYTLPLAATALGSTVDSDPRALTKAAATPTALQEPADDLNISPTSAVCSACHDSDLAKTHMRQSGGSFAVLQDNIE